MSDNTTPDQPPGAAGTDDAPVTEAQFTEPAHEPVRALVGSLDFLAPAAEPALEQMPDDVWVRLQDTIGREAAARAVDSFDNVVALPERSRGRGVRWAGGLVAASVAIVAAGLAIGTINAGNQGAIVAGGEATPAIAAALDETGSPAPAPFAAAAAPSAEAASDTAAQVEAVPNSSAPLDAAAGAAPRGSTPRAARMVKATSTNYTKAELPAQVTSLLSSVNVHSPQEAALMPEAAVTLPVGDGFTTTWQTLRECLTWLAKSSRSEALVVDRATYEGAAAGIIVAPADLVDEATSPPPTAVVPTPMGILHVWVVKPECQKAKDGIVNYVPYTWQP